MAYAEALAALADRTRRNILEALRDKPRTVGELAKDQPVSRPAVSQHLRVLESAQLVSVRKLGNRRLYSIRRDGLDDLRQYLDSFWSDVLSAYGAEIARRADNDQEGLLDPIVKSIDVPCPQQRAFEIFVHEMSSWWPLDKFTISAMAGEPTPSLSVEARKGGKIVEVAADGTEHYWGTILNYDPHDYLSMDFHITRPGIPRGPGSQVEVRFTPVSDDRTRVELTQSGWEAFGEQAEMMRGGYGMGWTMIFEQAYGSACSG